MASTAFICVVFHVWKTGLSCVMSKDESVYSLPIGSVCVCVCICVCAYACVFVMCMYVSQCVCIHILTLACVSEYVSRA